VDSPIEAVPQPVNRLIRNLIAPGEGLHVDPQAACFGAWCGPTWESRARKTDGSKPKVNLLI
jgi:hypothetical protein